MPNTIAKRITLGLLSPILAILLILGLGLPAFAQTKPQVDLRGKNVLVLHALEANMPLNVRTDRAIIAALEAGGIGMRNQFFEYLDLQRNPGPEHRKRLVEMMHLRYGKRNIDVIITLYPEALKFLLKDCREIFPDAPIVALFMAPGFELPKTGHHIIQHVFRCDMKGTLEIALKLVPKAKRVYVVGGVHSLDKKNEAHAREDFKKWEGQLTFRYLSDTSLEEMLATVSSAPPETIIFYMAMTGDITGKTYNPRDVAERLRQVSNGPVFGLYETLLEHGIVGGSIVSYRAIGTQAGTLALSILGIGSTSDKTSEILDVPGVPMFDWRELRHWKLSENALPKGSIVINKETTFWDFRYYIIGALAFCLVETALIIFLIVQRRRKNLAEEALEERLRFERLVSDISARFVNIPPDRVDSEIELGLRGILEFFQVDRCGLIESLPGKTSWRITHVAYSDDVPPVPAGAELPISMYPWSYEKLTLKREVVAYSRLDDLPQEANIDKQTYREWKIRSCMNIPILIGEPVDHMISINSVKSERGWPEEFIPRLRLLGEIFVNALERKQIRLQIEERLRFEGLVSNLSAGFVNVPRDKFDSRINRELRSITEFFDVDRCSIGLFSRDGTQVALAFEYHSEGAIPPPESMSKEQMPWFIEQLIQGKPVVMSRVEDLPLEAQKERQLCLAKGMKSLLAIPMLIEGKTLGSCALVSTRAERVWPEELVQRFRLISEVFANALQRKRAEAEAYQARSQLLQLDRLSRMGELTASLAHELNQPLAAILSNAQAGLRFLQSGKIDLNEVREILQDIIQDDQRAGNVIRSLRSMIKREEVYRNPIILNNVLNDVVQIFHTESVFRNVHVETEFDGSLPPVLGDKVQLQQVVLNLILNAADAVSDNPPEYRQIILRTGVKNDRARVTVRDFGPGIDKVNLECIFQPFFTTKGTGLGMGLSVCRTIVEAHEGRIWAENNPDRGATFVFELPVISNQ
jgi:signal transduction histidine kinase